MKYRTALFDLDGTLLNTLDDLASSTNYALSSFGYPVRTREEVCSFVGNGVKKLIERALPAGAENFNEVFSCFLSHYAEHCNDSTKPYEGILPVLRQLKERGVGLAIVSNKAHAAVQILKKLYFDGVVDVAIGENEAGGVRKKPAPDSVLQAMAQLHADPATAVYIGDSDVDIQTAKNARLPCISVLWGFRDRAFLEASGATCFVKKTEELLNFFV